MPRKEKFVSRGIICLSAICKSPENSHSLTFGGLQYAWWAPATKVSQNLSIVAKNENSTEHFVHLYMKNTHCELN